MAREGQRAVHALFFVTKASFAIGAFLVLVAGTAIIFL